eukprot:CAMPEP_0119192878 /NCGR_PEP_ID=MMETSP1316-20130426/3230_1 /TAXON_ID=41880 /ORGANISM="Pycnococcus provasolii, Strain RCC2336" /LENGTH=151 /DNA_ID=CAMNT_0007188087 /DNA_START=373 /DNA_END=825 /DNA_ORIENTATION=+
MASSAISRAFTASCSALTVALASLSSTLKKPSALRPCALIKEDRARASSLIEEAVNEGSPSDAAPDPHERSYAESQSRCSCFMERHTDDEARPRPDSSAKLNRGHRTVRTTVSTGSESNVVDADNDDEESSSRAVAETETETDADNDDEES